MKQRVKALGIEDMEYDGCSEIWVKTWEDWEKFGSVRPRSLDIKEHELTPITERGVHQGVNARCTQIHGIAFQSDGRHPCSNLQITPY